MLIFSVGQIEILAFNLRHFNVVADRRRKRAIKANKCDGNASQVYYTRTVLKDCIVHHNSIIRSSLRWHIVSSVTFFLSYSNILLFPCYFGCEFKQRSVLKDMLYLLCLLNYFNCSTYTINEMYLLRTSQSKTPMIKSLIFKIKSFE